ncbi:MAG: type II secretion system protein GspL [Solimonas sp.]
MRETLYIRLRSADMAEPVEHCVARADALASFIVRRAPLADVAALTGTRRVVVLVPSADLRFASVQVPARQPAKVLQAAPYVLEDQLAEDVDELHFALGARQPDGRWPLAIIAQQRMQIWLELLADHGIRADLMIPDLLALQPPGEQQFNALIDGTQAIVRSGRDSGFVCLLDDLPFCLGLADPERTRTLRVVVPRGDVVDVSVFGWPVEPRHGFATALDALLQQLQTAEAIDLLQGRYSPKRDRLRWFAPWKVAASLVGVAVALSLVTHGIEAFRLSRELAAQDAANVERYQQVFPNETRIVDLDAQLTQQIASLQSGGGQFIRLLDALAQALAAQPGLRLQNLQYRDSVLYVGLGAANLDLLERLKSWFAGAHGARLDVESANAGAEGVQIRIRLSAA